jgi:dTDP-L-rhamnose 4-epimerase
MNGRVLITGGAGFIGSHLADELLARGYRARVLDNLDPQVHGSGRKRPSYLARDVELIVGDIRDRETVTSALAGVDTVVHLAARVGVGQSMYEIVEYTSVNNVGTAVLLEVLIDRPVRRLVVASSMCIYGEGLYRDAERRLHGDIVRNPAQLARGDWEPAIGGRALTPVPTPESKQPTLTSVYALSKYAQECKCLMTGDAYQIPTVALRFFNVYGTRQAISNPYTGVLAIFASRLLNKKSPLVFEDGRQRRDFVHVRDVVNACRLAIETDAAVGEVFNIGSGRAYPIVEIAERMARVLGVAIPPEITGQYRVGDIRHCTADISRARQVLGYEPATELDTGLTELASWLSTQHAIDRADAMRAELASRGVAL